jgi:hypothetical protein
MNIIKKLQENYVSTVVLTIYSMLPTLLYYWTGEFKWLVAPVDKAFGGMYPIVLLVFALIGMLLSTLVEVKLKWRGF